MITVLECDESACDRCGHISNCKIFDIGDDRMQIKMEHDLEDFLDYQEDREM